MKILFLSNFFNHHQAPLSDALWEKTGGEYLFVETEPMPPERKALGYSAVPKPYTVPWKGNEALILRKLREADAVIAGSAPERLIRERIRTGKLLFRYSERPLRNGMEPLKYLPRLLRWHWRNPPGKPIYLLCAGAYAAGDYAKFGLFRNRAFRWGYFPERKIYDTRVLFSEKCTTEILWCGRLLELKHPEAALLTAERLKKEGFCFQLTVIGTGELEEELCKRVKERGLEGSVRFLGAKKPEQVRAAMEKAGICLFTSDRREGWGAVVNEAMNSGCAVIASHAAGAVPYLIRDGENGMIYASGDVEMLFAKIKYLLEYPREQERLGTAAYAAIRDRWNAETAAERLLLLTERILAGEESPKLFADGPCSPAEERKDRWFL